MIVTTAQIRSAKSELVFRVSDLAVNLALDF